LRIQEQGDVDGHLPGLLLLLGPGGDGQLAEDQPVGDLAADFPGLSLGLGLLLGRRAGR